MKVIPNVPKYPFIAPYSFLTTFSRDSLPYHYYTYRLLHQSIESRVADVVCTCFVLACVFRITRHPSLCAWLLGVYAVSVALYTGDVTLALVCFGLVYVVETLAGFIRSPFRVLGYVVFGYAFLYHYFETDTLLYVTHTPLEELPLVVLSGMISRVFGAPRSLIQAAITCLEYDGSIRYPTWQEYVDRAFISGHPSLHYIGES